MRSAIWNGLLLAVVGALAVDSALHLQPASADRFVREPPALKVAAADGPGPLFDPNSVLVPGRQLVRAVSVRGGGSVALFVTGFTPRSADSAITCTTPNPADRINLIISTGGGAAYQGTLSGFATRHASPQTALRIGISSNSTIVFQAGLDSSAGNDYMGCRSTAQFNWRAV